DLDDLLHQPPRADITDDANEIALARIEGTERSRVLLAVRLIGVVADRLQAQHGDQLFAALAASAGIDPRAPAGRLKVGRFFVGEGHEPERLLRPAVREAAR